MSATSLNVGSGGQLPTTCDANLDPNTKCTSPAVVLFHLGQFVIVPRCSMHAEACRTALRRFLRASSWSEERVLTDGGPRAVENTGPERPRPTVALPVPLALQTGHRIVESYGRTRRLLHRSRLRHTCGTAQRRRSPIHRRGRRFRLGPRPVLGAIATLNVILRSAALLRDVLATFVHCVDVGCGEEGSARACRRCRVGS